MYSTSRELHSDGHNRIRKQDVLYDASLDVRLSVPEYFPPNTTWRCYRWSRHSAVGICTNNLVPTNENIVLLPANEKSQLLLRKRSCVWWTRTKCTSGTVLLLTIAIIVLLCVITVDATVSSALMTASSNATEEMRLKQGICGDIDIRNSVDKFKSLENCRVIEGFLQILLIDRANESEYKNLSFPKLREITGYFLIYRVYGLKTLRNIFPNLSVIRGSKLFHNYAFVIFEVLHIQDIGLSSLTDILRGSVRIEKNRNLCYVDTINWDLIAKSGKGGHFIKGNRGSDECPKNCPDGCPTGPNRQPLCWNNQKCQIVCTDQCGDYACQEKSSVTPWKSSAPCCSNECVGGCNGSSVRDCFACRHTLLEGLCVERCSKYTYKYMDFRCVTLHECASMPIPLDVVSPGPAPTWKPFNGTCSMECPSGYKEVPSGGIAHCQPCEGQCPKICPSIVVKSISDAQLLRGCTKISGTLDIQIGGGQNVIKELEENLKAITEIDGFLKISRSASIVSLNFLKNLRIIRGRDLEQKRYAMVVLENRNLQELWDWENGTRSLNISNGNLFFHYNPMLCLDKIKELQNITGTPKFESIDVSETSNGDRVSCQLEKLSLNISIKRFNAVVINWSNFKTKLADHRSLLGYVVSYIETMFQNVSIYEGRDGCGGDEWQVIDAPSSELDIQLITGLKPFTQYAIHVKTYTIASEVRGAESDIIYFTTDPSEPSPPLDIISFSNSSSEIVVTWKPPLHSNGNVTNYNVYIKREREDASFLEQRDYCKEPVSIPNTKTKEWTDEPTENVWTEEDTLDENKRGKKKENCCTCPKTKAEKEKEEQEANFQIVFEDFLHNMVYIKRPMRSHDRRKRSIMADSSGYVDVKNIELDARTDVMQSTESGYQSTAKYDELSGNDQEFFHMAQAIKVYAMGTESVQYVARNLHHFTEYTVAVEACRERIKNDNADANRTLCSAKSITVVRTHKWDDFDNIDASKVFAEVSNHSVGEIKIKWEEPSSPNGLLVAYHVEYMRADISNIKPLTECITRKQFQSLNRSYVIQNLPPGNYSVRVRASSLAGMGEYTSPKFVVILEATAALTTAAIIGITIAALIGCAMMASAIYAYRTKWGRNNGILFASVNPEYMSVGDVYIPDEWEVAREKIVLIRELGQGSFGMVYEGTACDLMEGQEKVDCAVKTVNEHASDRERLEFLNEASVMKAFKCHHVVRLMGVVSKSQPTLVVMELMANGDLKTYLRKHRPDNPDNQGLQPPTLKQIMQMAAEIADGMSYLSAKKFVHRDLAARNCMVADDLTVKIGDFGMTRDIYETDYYRKGSKGLLPVRWMSPESLKDGIFTSHSDVWGYGVVLWEMATLASQPYQGLSNEQVLHYVIDAGIMERPENCPMKLYELMCQCWQHNPKMRPSFMDLIQDLLVDVNENYAHVSFYHSPKGMECRAQAMNSEDLLLPEIEEASPMTPLRIADPEYYLARQEVDDLSDIDGDDDRLVIHFAHDLEGVKVYSLAEGQNGVTPDGSKGTNSSDSSKTSLQVANGYITNHCKPLRTGKLKMTEC